MANQMTTVSTQWQKPYTVTKKPDWDEQFTTTPFTPPHMNTVIIKIWAILSCEVGRVIVQAFGKAHPIPLKPPATVEAALSTCLTVL